VGEFITSTTVCIRDFGQAKIGYGGLHLGSRKIQASTKAPNFFLISKGAKNNNNLAFLPRFTPNL